MTRKQKNLLYLGSFFICAVIGWSSFIAVIYTSHEDVTEFLSNKITQLTDDPDDDSHFDQLYID